MRIGIIALALALGGCQTIEYPSHGPDAGNPNHMAYAGASGSVYDRAANPPSDIGRSSYDAYGPLTDLPAGDTLPPPGAAAPLNPPG